MVDGSSGRPASSGKKRQPGRPGHRQATPRKRRPLGASAEPAATRSAATAESQQAGSPWAALRSGRRGTPRQRGAGERLKTIRILVIMGTVLAAAGVVGAIVAAVLALGHESAELPFAEKYVLPVEFILVVIVVYAVYAAVNGLTWLRLRHGEAYKAVRIAMFGGLGMLFLMVMGVIAGFGQQGFLLAIAVAQRVPYLLGPLIVLVPVTAAAGYVALSARRQFQPGV